MKTIVLAIAFIGLGFAIRSMVQDPTATAAPVRESMSGRYALSSYAPSTTDPSGGCYILDTSSGKLWHADKSGPRAIGTLPEDR